MKKFSPVYLIICIVIALTFTILSCGRKKQANHKNTTSLTFNQYDKIYTSHRPYTRWWWFARKIKKENIRYQLDWLKRHHFGGVEIAWIYPVNRNPDAERTKWLSNQWTKKVSYTKKYADSIGLGCDFTFGTLWPFGGTFVADSDATSVYGDPDFRQPLRLSWTHPDTGNVLDHMDKAAFERYANTMGEALKPALKGSLSGLFCDSWEVETRRIWTKRFGKSFKEQYGYDIRPYMDSIYAEKYKHERYDYMQLVAEYVLNNFYKPFTKKSHELGAFSRVQCAGSPTDLIRAYANVDVPETEAMLYEPNFGKIVSSAALLAGKPIISSETFTCLYGYPDQYHSKEQTADLKMVADALFANGVNQIIWHGMPYNPKGVDSIEFYATVHVGETGNLTSELKPFNDYMTKVSSYMRKGEPYSDIAVYLPLEDSWVAGEYPKEKQMEWSWGAYELRYQYMPEELNGYQPHWINHHFLKKARWGKNTLHCGNATFNALYVDVNYLDYHALRTIYNLAEKGLPVCLKQMPTEPGKEKTGDYYDLLKRLNQLDNVSPVKENVITSEPLVQSAQDIFFRARITKDHIFIFFPHPKAWNLTLPLEYGFSHTSSPISKNISIHYNGKDYPLTLDYKPYQSLLLKIPKDRKPGFIDISYLPPTPVKQ